MSMSAPPLKVRSRRKGIANDGEIGCEVKMKVSCDLRDLTNFALENYFFLYIAYFLHCTVVSAGCRGRSPGSLSETKKHKDGLAE